MLSQRDVRRINEDQAFWKEFEHDNWLLMSFTDRVSAKYGWNECGAFTKYVTVERAIVKFMRGVEPDVLDKLDHIDIPTVG